MSLLLKRFFIAASIFQVCSGVSPVEYWNQVALDTIRTVRTPAPRLSRSLAVLHLAIFDAVNGIEPAYPHYLVPANCQPGTSKDAAVHQTSFRVLTAEFPDAATKTKLEAKLQAQLAALPDGAAKAQGIAWGDAVAAAVLQHRSNDGAAVGDGGCPDFPPAPGRWVPPSPSIQLCSWGNVRPFSISSVAAFLPSKPVTLSTVQYAAEFNQVARYGNKTSTVRTPEQTEIAQYWAQGGGTSTTPGMWNSIGMQIAKSKNLSMLDEALVMAQLNMALADASFACWKGKFDYYFWRPNTAICNAATDGNAYTTAQLKWESLLPTPPFPEHASGHATLSAAAAKLLSCVFRSDAIAFEFKNQDFNNVSRSFPSLSAAASEAGISRVYGGVHFMTAIVEGLRVGQAIGCNCRVPLSLKVCKVPPGWCARFGSQLYKGKCNGLEGFACKDAWGRRMTILPSNNCREVVVKSSKASKASCPEFFN